MTTKINIEIDANTQKNIDLWLNGQYDEETKSRIRSMLKNNPQQAIDSFFTNLTFGTAGLRGIMGDGSNRMNIYTVRAATQGLANYMLKQPKSEKELAVFIGYDSRYHSKEFAEETAKVLASNGIKAYLCPNIRPTPFVSFGCRNKNCLAAVMVTASHNPAEYNGYKVYWSDGGQVTPPNDTGIINEVSKITNPSMVKITAKLDNPLIEYVGEDLDEAYVKAIASLQQYPEINHQHGKRLNIVYTSLHGTGITLAPSVFKSWGFSNLRFVDKQVIPDGSFPTVKFPNPEVPETMKLGVDLMLQNNDDIFIANDPDADRVGVGVNHHGKAVLLNGNQIATLCLEHLCEALSAKKQLNSKKSFIKSIVTTELFQAICDHYKVSCFNVLTGFKYFAAKIHEWELSSAPYQYVFGAEESYGYLLGSFSRDKDGISADVLICEAALQAKLKGKTLVDQLYDIYKKYGIYFEEVVSIDFGATKEGIEKMAQSMESLRQSSLTSIDNIPLSYIEDYKQSTKLTLSTNTKEKISLPSADILLYRLQDGSKVIIRPSGTEPKVKIYCGILEKDFENVESGLKKAEKKCASIVTWIKNLMASPKSGAK